MYVCTGMLGRYRFQQNALDYMKHFTILNFQSTIQANKEKGTVMHHALFQVSTIPGAIYPTVPTIPVVCGAEG
jgi:hypothetical protein